MHRPKSRESLTTLDDQHTPVVLQPEIGEGSAILQHHIPDLNQPPPIPIWRLSLITIAFWAVQFGWAIQIAFSTPLFLEMGVPEWAVSLIWLDGPLTGLVISPVVGIVSDRTRTRWGRRRPFIVFGGLGIMFGMFLISSSEWISSIFISHDNPDASQKFHIVLTILGFFFMDSCNATVQGPARGLLMDIAPSSQQALGSSMFGIFLGLGNLTGWLFGSLQVAEGIEAQVRLLLRMAMGAVFVCICLTAWAAKERTEDLPVPQANGLVTLWRGFIKMPSAMRRIVAVNFFSWLAWCPYLLYITTWCGENVFNGDPYAPVGTIERSNFEDGVSFGSMGLMINAALSTVGAFLLPRLIKWPGLKITYFTFQMILCLLLFSTIFITEKWSAFFVISIAGIPWSGLMVLPYVLVSMSVDDVDAGMYYGILNFFIVLPQMLLSTFIGAFNQWTGDVKWAMQIGSASAALSAGLVWTLILNAKAGHNPSKVVFHSAH